MDVASRPLHSPLLLSCRRPWSSSLSHSSTFSSYRGQSSIKLPTLTSTSISALSSFSCLSRKHTTLPWCCTSEEQFNAPTCFNGTISKHTKLFTRIVAQSELAGVGITDTDINPSSGLSLSPSMNLFRCLVLCFNSCLTIAFRNAEVSLLSKARGIGFYTVTAIAALLLIVLMLVQHPLVLLADRYRRKAHHLVASVWATITVNPFFKIEFEGVENLPPSDTPAVYVSNHQSFLDIYTLLTLGRSFKFISKTAIFLYPVIGWAMSMLGTIPLKRMDSRSQLECLKRCIDLVNKGASVFFFPEGTRSKDGKLGAFKKGAFSIAVKTGVPVVPMTLIGTGGIMPPGKEAILNMGSVKVIIHKPIQGNDAAALCEEARTVIAGPLNQQS
ncbi:unnamed protein product [Linum tenue]|uniref:1-acyl-sn-glycerol-3-phosphate acyltransferase n=1 Tax=Linum tenue TaxID=586396 RepID=A0AAV0IBS6_9ROSI|nr:unnamed protein product [Linum tenue]